MISLKKIKITELKPLQEFDWHKIAYIYEIYDGNKLIDYAINLGQKNKSYRYASFADPLRTPYTYTTHPDWLLVPIANINNAINTAAKADLKKNWEFKAKNSYTTIGSSNEFKKEYTKRNHGLSKALEHIATVSPEDEFNSVMLPYSEIQGAKVFIVKKDEWIRLREKQKRSKDMEDTLKLPNQEVGILINAKASGYYVNSSTKRSVIIDAKSDEYIVLTPSKVSIAGEELYCIILMPRKEKTFKNITEVV